MLNFRTLSIFRLEADVSDESGLESGEQNYKRELADTGRIITGILRSASAEQTALAEGEYGRTFSFATDDFSADIVIGDEVREGSDRYSVKAVDASADGPGRKMSIILVKGVAQ